MFGIVIVGHAGLAKEYLSAVEHVVGKQANMCAIGISAECNREKKQEDICKAVDSVDTGDGVVVVTDMFGGSPSNLSLKACNGKCQTERRVIYGANLPMLIKLAKCRKKPLNTAVDAAVDAGRKYLDCLPSSDA